MVFNSVHSIVSCRLNRTKVKLKTISELIIYYIDDGKVSVTLLSKDGDVWMNQQQLAELFELNE